jgi:hypothetical protein
MSSLICDRTDFGIRDQRLLELQIFIVTQILLHQARERLGFDEAEHVALYGNDGLRRCRMTLAVRPKRDQVNRPAAADVRQKEDPYRRVRLNAWLGPGHAALHARCALDWTV